MKRYQWSPLKAGFTSAESRWQFEGGVLGEDALNLTTKILQWNPEYYTMWNRRRLLIQRSVDSAKARQHDDDHQNEGSDDRNTIHELLTTELDFLIPLLRQYPKCYWIWKYRLWLLQQANQSLPSKSALEIWQRELHLDSKMLAQDSRNFHAWGYRRTIRAAVEGIQASEKQQKPLEESPGGSSAILEQEFEYSTKMISTNLSNFSAWHHRSKLLPDLLDARETEDRTRREVLDTELELVQRALYTGDNDQSPWFYYQYLISNLDPRSSARSIAPNLSETERLQYLRDEIEKVVEMIEDADDNKWIYQALIQMALLYRSLSGVWPEQASNREEWIGRLESLDPLRSGRWQDLKEQIK